MFEPLSIPVWLVVVFGLFGIVGLLDRVVGPGVRWFFHRKANQAIEELNTRLHLRIQPFKTTRRQALIDRLLLDQEVVNAIETRIQDAEIPRDVAMAQAERYAREIVPAFNAYAYFKVGTRFARWISTFIYRVRLGFADDSGISSIDPEATVVFVMNHRSNMDYILVTYLASANATLSYAVGEWARVWLLQNLIRVMGAFFIRRESGNVLYRRVLARYVALATRSGVTQAIFPEGGLSRDGLLREPKFGLLSYMIADFDKEKDRDVVFVPVGLNYDRVLEDRVLTNSGQTKVGKRTFSFNFVTAIRFVWGMVVLRFKGRLYRYGYACASFGSPVSLKQWCDDNNAGFSGSPEEQVFRQVEKVGRKLMQDVADCIPVLPVAIVASVFLDADYSRLSELEIKGKSLTLMQSLQRSGSQVYIPRGDQDYAISTGLRMLTLRHLVVETDGKYEMAAANRSILAYYANSIRHLRRNSSSRPL